MSLEIPAFFLIFSIRDALRRKELKWNISMPKAERNLKRVLLCGSTHLKWIWWPSVIASVWRTFHSYTMVHQGNWTSATSFAIRSGEAVSECPPRASWKWLVDWPLKFEHPTRLVFDWSIVALHRARCKQYKYVAISESCTYDCAQVCGEVVLFRLHRLMPDVYLKPNLIGRTVHFSNIFKIYICVIIWVTSF